MLFICSACGYRVIRWDEQEGRTLYIAPVEVVSESAPLAVRFRDALREQCLTKTNLVPVNREPSDLMLITKVVTYQEHVVATDVDGRTSRMQFTVSASFQLVNAEGETVWQLPVYQFSEQYQLSSTSAVYRDESKSVQDEALTDVADLVMTNIVLALMEQ
ncbi:MAG: hypothetical protein KDC35_14585 [Acidobacteria bacterium]|nr:hypothetical protein [Acidobacteriota bacterium]